MMNNNILYHYTSGLGLYGIINSSEIYCSEITFLNDPTEHKYFDDVVKKLFNNSPDCQEIYNTLYNESFHGITYDFHEYYIMSLSKNNDSLSMWNYYSKGNGYNLGLNYESIIKRNENKLGPIFIINLVYDIDEQYQTLKKFIKSFKKDILKTKSNKSKEIKLDEELEKRFNNGLINFRLSFKHSAYAREEEVRILVAKPKTSDSKVFFRLSNNGVIVEYVKLQLDLKNDLKTIMVHPQGSDLHISGLVKFMYSKNIDLQIEKSQIPFREV
ncbi:DUF2971 domain-containing protein [Mariniflexile sp. HNIBRBA6329]|uniref:DUF2971 domain-containing protein n=1 Tax=Mariniflexile sp. HNIBRBA6329 TaxID=3373088 RepID=UPI003744EA51